MIMEMAITDVLSMCARSFMVGCVLVGSAEATADDVQRIKVQFDGVVSSNIPAFVYVNGELRGAAPGVIEFKKSTDPSLVEIGVPQMDVPLYSMVLEPSASNTSDVNVSTSLVEPGSVKKGFWDSVLVAAPAREQGSLGLDKTGVVELTLPAQALLSLTNSSSKLGFDPFDKSAAEFVPLENYLPASSAVTHLTYSKALKKIEALNMTQNEVWSGGISAATKASLGVPLLSEIWRVKSVPPGAEIWTESGSRGRTDTDINVEISSGTRMVLVLDGYAQCPRADCQESRLADRVEYVCTLRPLN